MHLLAKHIAFPYFLPDLACTVRTKLQTHRPLSSPSSLPLLQAGASQHLPPLGMSASTASGGLHVGRNQRNSLPEQLGSIHNRKQSSISAPGRCVIKWLNYPSALFSRHQHYCFACSMCSHSYFEQMVCHGSHMQPAHIQARTKFSTFLPITCFAANRSSLSQLGSSSRHLHPAAPRSPRCLPLR